MAFSLRVKIMVEYRGMASGMGKNDKPWMSLQCETMDGSSEVHTIDVTVPHELQADVYGCGLRKGDVIEMDVTARAGTGQNGRAYSYIALNKVPKAVADYDGVVA